MNASGLRTVFLGNDAWSVPPLRALASSTHTPALVLTRTPRPRRRGSGVVPTAVASEARERGLALAEIETVRSGPGRSALLEANADALVVVAYGEILPADVLGAGRLGAVNVHFSLLPELRGAAPVQRALLEGLERTGVTIMLMDEGLDTGPVLRQEIERIRPDDDAGSLGTRLAELGGRLLVRSLDDLASGTAQPIEQNDADASLAPKLSKAERILDWTDEAPSLVHRVRALAPEPGATTTFRGGGLKVLRAQVGDGGGDPGLVLDAARGALVVAAGAGAVRILEVAPAGRKRMAAAEFVNGFRPSPGERFG